MSPTPPSKPSLQAQPLTTKEMRKWSSLIFPPPNLQAHRQRRSDSSLLKLQAPILPYMPGSQPLTFSETSPWGHSQHWMGMLFYLSSLKKQLAVMSSLSAPAPFLLPVLAKQLRRVVSTHCLHFFTSQSLPCPLQYGISPHHATPQLVELTSSFHVVQSFGHFAVLILASQQHLTPSLPWRHFL